MLKPLLNRTRALLAAFSLALVAAITPQVASAQALSDFFENKVVDEYFRAQAPTLNANIFVGLSTAACSDSAVGTEVATGSYARASIARSLANWAGTQAAASTTASTGTGGQTSNNVAITFATPTASWGTVTHFFLADAVTGGNIYVCQALTTSKTINTGDTVSFPIGSITVTLQ